MAEVTAGRGTQQSATEARPERGDSGSAKPKNLSHVDADNRLVPALA
jgi:hypothetical protein